MNLNIEIPDTTLASLVLEKIVSGNTIVSSATSSQLLPGLPPIGTYWHGQGGIFAGLMRGRDGGKDYALILGSTFQNGNFKDTQDRAMAVEVDGHKDFRCPYRNEQSLLIANLKDQFKPEWYWSCERHQGGEAYAWVQDFKDGSQDLYGVSYECLGCAVRVIPLQ